LRPARLGTDPRLAALTPLLIAHTAGHPCCRQERVQTLVATQVLVGARGGSCLAHPLASLQVPATVQAVLAARLDRRPPEEARLLQTAVVIGNEVPRPLLQAIAERPEAGPHRGLGHLQAAEFRYATRLFPEPD
jgi:predicted ATPase